MKDLTWKHVTIVTVLIAGICALTITGHDAGALTGVAMLVMAGLGIVIQQGQTAKEQTNGRIGDLIKLVEKQTMMLAASPPPAQPADPPSIEAAQTVP